MICKDSSNLDGMYMRHLGSSDASASKPPEVGGRGVRAEGAGGGIWPGSLSPLSLSLGLIQHLRRVEVQMQHIALHASDTQQLILPTALCCSRTFRYRACCIPPPGVCAASSGSTVRGDDLTRYLRQFAQLGLCISASLLSATRIRVPSPRLLATSPGHDGLSLIRAALHHPLCVQRLPAR